MSSLPLSKFDPLIPSPAFSHNIPTSFLEPRARNRSHGNYPGCPMTTLLSITTISNFLALSTTAAMTIEYTPCRSITLSSGLLAYM